jgi:hypothetical protein
MATCTSDIELNLLGSKEVVRIGKGTVVDLDRVIGERDGKPETIADQLGPHVQHFHEEAAPRTAPRRSPAPSGAEAKE